jgi:sulfatase modifying factor 1
LPTDAEWEYACRAGTQTTWIRGDTPESLRGTANVADHAMKQRLRTNTHLSHVNNAVPWDDGFAFSAPVGRYPPNPFGLFDMDGNVAEWCQDAYLDPANAGIVAPAAFNFRGGSWGYAASNARPASRNGFPPHERWANIGFRVVRESN